MLNECEASFVYKVWSSFVYKVALNHSVYLLGANVYRKLTMMPDVNENAMPIAVITSIVL